MQHISLNKYYNIAHQQKQTSDEQTDGTFSNLIEKHTVEDIIKKITEYAEKTHAVKFASNFNLYIAGGLWTTSREQKQFDVDIFITQTADAGSTSTSPRMQQQDAELKRFIYELIRQNNIEDIHMRQNCLAWNVQIGELFIPIQLILTKYQNVEEILNGFDVAPAKIAYDISNENIIMTDDAFHAIRTWTLCVTRDNIVEPRLISRMKKYVNIKGFGITFETPELRNKLSQNKKSAVITMNPVHCTASMIIREGKITSITEYNKQNRFAFDAVYDGKLINPKNVKGTPKWMSDLMNPSIQIVYPSIINSSKYPASKIDNFIKPTIKPLDIMIRKPKTLEKSIKSINDVIVIVNHVNL